MVPSDEGTPHIQERHVFDCRNQYGELYPQQEKALEELGFDPPHPEKPKSKYNRRKNVFDAACREILFDIAERHGVHLEREPIYGGREYLEKQDDILLFHGLLYCADCGKSMQVRYEKVGRTDVNRTTKEKREAIDKAYYICQTYNRMGCKVCLSHKIEARDLYNLVLEDIRELAAEALRNENAFYQRLTAKLSRQYQSDTSSLEREAEKLSARNQEIDDTILSLYTDKSKGILTEQRFLKLSMALENEQKSNSERIREVQALLHDSADQESDIRTFIDQIRQYEAITELDEGILNHLIDKILIGDAKKVNGEKVQEVRIFYNFVGEATGKTA